MRVLLLLLLIAFLCPMLLAACGDDKKSPGSPCTPTQEGAAECESGVCLTGIQCQNGKTVDTACAGPDCASSFTCSGGMQCVQVSGSAMAFCLPPTLCESSGSDAAP
jgi:hypothetical protein